uniref:Uncharacterized protein n=1 Tax=Rhizophora mucronata TaxID=61149 RepID=A0A2P2QFY8_RHIMU
MASESRVTRYISFPHEHSLSPCLQLLHL